jgi:hypothetical protein
MNEQTSELKACPFCGSPARLEFGTRAYIACTKCWMSIDEGWRYGETATDATARVVARWNTRPTPSPIVQAADEMERALNELYSHTGGMPVAEMYGNSAQYEHALGIYERALAALEHYAKAKGKQ